jgi:addiction module RelE/StbE family toxin
MAKVVWSPKALSDLIDIRDYIGLDSPIAAQHMAERLLQAGDSLAKFPDRGRAARRGLREWTLIYPYVLRYRVRGDIVEIVRIKHGAQRPD